MQNKLTIYNTLSRKKEKFEPINAPHVGLYVCGPTVYGEPHLGHARPAITFDILFRYLKHLGYKVRYVRNITDVGHLEDELAGTGEDKIAKKARLEQLEPMEVVQTYKNKFNEIYQLLNVLPPSIEPQASGHIIEQQEMVQKILDNGFAYEINGSVYFDVVKYNKENNYGKLSGRKTEDLLSNTRELDGQQEKRSSLDFALWKKAEPEHIMKWSSHWSEGFPGWHLECSTMGTKYLGDTFDIHGGGLDLLFPHHECEIAQSVAANGKDHVKYWMHNNMVTINGQKMGKSLGNFINLSEFFSGSHKLVDRAFSPMTIRFFMLQAHYRSTLDFSNDALAAAEKGLEKLITATELIENLPVSDSATVNFKSIEEKCYAALNDDLNTPIAIAQLFDGVKTINAINSGKEKTDKAGLESLKNMFNTVVYNILGLQNESTSADKDGDSGNSDEIINLLLDLRVEFKQNKNFEKADFIRNELLKLGVEVKDSKDGDRKSVV